MTQDQLKDFIRQRFDCREFLKKSSGCSLYICPKCGSGCGQHKTGAVQYYPDTQRWYCHKCRTLGDIFTLYELEHGVNFNTALRALAEQLGTSVEPHSTKPARKCPPAPSPVQSGSAPKDLSDYFAACRARLYDPAAIAYLAERRISPETAVAYGLGFDPKADPAGSHRCCPRIIIPTNCFHYVARSIDPDAQPGCRTMNNLGATPDLFNRQALYAPGTSTRRFGRWRNSLVRRSSRTAQSPLGSAHPLRLPCSPALHRRICLITSRRVVPDCMTLPPLPTWPSGESVRRQLWLMDLASTPKQTRQEVTAAARELSSRQTVSTTSHAVSTRMHNRGAGR